MKGTEYEILHAGVFSPNDLCEVTVSESHNCLHFNNENYVEDSIFKSSFVDKVWSIISLPVCENHPMTLKFKEMLGDKQFGLAYMKTLCRENYKSIPGIRVTEFNKGHKRVNISMEISLWVTVGQLMFLSAQDVNSLSIEVHSPVGKMQL